MKKKKTESNDKTKKKKDVEKEQNIQYKGKTIEPVKHKQCKNVGYVVPEIPNEASDSSSWDGFIKTLSETQANILKQLTLGKSECKVAQAPETDPKHASPQNQYMPKVKKEQNGEKEGCPIKKLPISGSYEGVQLIKKHHVTLLKKKFDDSKDSESNMKVMQKESNGPETSGDSEEKTKRKSSRPIKIPLVKDNGEKGPPILPLDSPKKKRRK